MVQVAEVALLPNSPSIMAVLPAQMVCGAPASTVAAGFTVITAEPVADWVHEGAVV